MVTPSSPISVALTGALRTFQIAGSQSLVDQGGNPANPSVRPRAYGWGLAATLLAIVPTGAMWP